MCWSVAAPIMGGVGLGLLGSLLGPGGTVGGAEAGMGLGAGLGGGSAAIGAGLGGSAMAGLSGAGIGAGLGAGGSAIGAGLGAPSTGAGVGALGGTAAGIGAGAGAGVGELGIEGITPAFSEIGGTAAVTPEMSMAGEVTPTVEGGVAPMASESFLPPPGQGPAAPPNPANSSSMLDQLAGMYKSYWPYLAGAGILSNLAGNIVGSQQQKSNLGDYIGATTWTPDKASTYLTSMGQTTGGALAGSAAKAQGTLAERMATSGRGGGGYGQQSLALQEQALQDIAAARGKALTTVSTPPTLASGPFMSQFNPYASTLTGIGGTAGQGLTSGLNLLLLSNILGSRARA